MSSERDRHERIRTLFERAGRLLEDEREAWLREHAEDDAMVAEVLELLALAADSEPLPPVHAPTREAAGPLQDLIRRIASRRPGSPRYRSETIVGRGGMGAVLEVWDDELERRLAMKVILGAEGSSQGATSTEVPPHVLERFVEEAQVTGQLDHPGIVPVHELGVDADGRVFFTMRLVHGQTLREVFEQSSRGEESWTQARVVGLLLKACEALSFAHSRGVIHRDLKPANVMVGRFGEVYVMDWGLARVLGQEDRRDLRIRVEPQSTTSSDEPGSPSGRARGSSPLRTMDGDVVGTPAYMPPEQAAGRVEEVGPHSDVYAFGALLYQLLAGHAPFLDPDTTTDNLQLLRRVQQGPPTPLSQAAPGAPPELVAICDKAMARDWRQRYRDMAELSSDLSAYVEGRVVRAHETGAWAEARKWVRRNRPLAGALAAVLVAIVVGAAAFALKAEEATQAAERAREETAKVLRLSDMQVLQELQHEADALWPPYPDRIEDLESWLARAQMLLARRPDHLATLTEMRGLAGPWTEQERERDRRTHPRLGELNAQRAELEGLIAQLARGLQGEAREQAERHVAELERELPALAAEVESRRTWTLGTLQEQWQHDLLDELTTNLRELRDGLLGEDVITEAHGWSVPRRLAFAQGLQTAFAEGGEHASAWDEALPAIRRAYQGLELSPQSGLLPLGPDPVSGLWEFAHLMSGAPAERGTDGTLQRTGQTGVVLVLLPAGRFWMGAQASDPNDRNYDPQAKQDEGPVHEVELSAYFLSKYELTQGQWLWLTGSNPSHYRNKEPDPLLHPLEQVTWEDCMTWLPRAGLALPSEAQWEYAARGGTDTPWWTGAERESLQVKRAANLADQAAARTGASWPDIKDWPELEDGFAVHAPVGSLAANAFGLHDVAGNVWEWCLDGYDGSFFARSPVRDPMLPWESSTSRMCRGGSYINAARSARSALRGGNGSPSIALNIIGARPAAGIRSP